MKKLRMKSKRCFHRSREVVECFTLTFAAERRVWVIYGRDDIAKSESQPREVTVHDQVLLSEM